MQQQASFSTHRDRLGGRLAELARKLDGVPSQRTIEMVRSELDRLALG
jgi:hypothetical protein